MRASPIETALRETFAACDALEARREDFERRREAGGGRGLAAARRAFRAARRRAERTVRLAHRSGALRPLLPADGLGPREVLLAIALLALRIREGPASIPGRRLLGLLHDDPLELVRGAALLEASAPLRAAGLVASGGEGDPLDADFRAGDGLYREACRRLRAAAPAAARPYADPRDHLLDLHRLATLARRRATLLFGEAAMEWLAEPGSDSLDEVHRAIAARREAIAARLAATAAAARSGFPALALARRNRLSESEMLVVSVLLFQSVLHGVATIEVPLLAKIVAEDERGLLDALLLLSPEAPLLAGKVLLLEEPAVDEKPATGEAYLAPAIEAELLGGSRARGISPGERSEFRRYLEGLKDSDAFFRDLGMGSA
ncbi:MAG: hypothetical protein L0216_02360 [Planctomycetales bacterium]|nr:hypothetical protein [Planctomycetales bacterium]